jgi:two-component system, cell cycle response regulator DivK
VERVKTVLVVEDYADVRMMMKIIIQHCGYKVLEASDGYEAVQTAQKHNPDLIFMDLSMPIMDGFAATQIIRKSENCSNVPIIALTAYGDLYYEKAMKAGCNDVINKPMHFDKIQPLIERYIN